MMRSHTVTAMALSIAALALGPALPAVAATTSPANPGAGYVLNFEDPATQGLPGQLPPGWAKEYQPAIIHADGQPQVRDAKLSAGEPVRAGTHSVRFELDKADAPLHNGSRAEISADNPAEPRGAERWYGFSTYLPRSWAYDQSPENIVQWHQEGGDCTKGCSPPLALNTQKGHYFLSQNWQKSLSVPGDWNFENTDIGAYDVGRWTDWVVHVKWSTGSDGLLQVWKDGQAVPGFTHKVGRTDDFGDQVHGNYIVLGIYKWPWYPQNQTSDTTNRVLYTDELRIADASGSYGVVAPPTSPGDPTGHLALTDGLQVTPGSAGAATTARFTVTNVGSSVITVPYFLVGARTAAGGHVDFAPSQSVTLSPGQSYTYEKPRTLAAGSYTAWPAYYDGSTWHELGLHTGFRVST